MEVRGQLVGLGPSLPLYIGLHDQIWVGRLWGKNLFPDPVTAFTPFIVFLRLPSIPSKRERKLSVLHGFLFYCLSRNQLYSLTSFERRCEGHL